MADSKYFTFKELIASDVAAKKKITSLNESVFLPIHSSSCVFPR